MLFCPLTKNSYGAIYAWIALTRQFGGSLGCDRLKNAVTVEVDSARNRTAALLRKPNYSMIGSSYRSGTSIRDPNSAEIFRRSAIATQPLTWKHRPSLLAFRSRKPPDSRLDPVE